MNHKPAEVRAAPKHREPPGQGRGYNHLESWRPVATPYRGDEASQKLKNSNNSLQVVPPEECPEGNSVDTLCPKGPCCSKQNKL